MCKKLMVGILFLTSGATYGIDQGGYLFGVGGISSGLYDRANTPLSTKAFMGSQFHYQWLERVSISGSILGGYPYSDRDEKFQSKHEGITIHSTMIDVSTKITLFSLFSTKMRVYTQAGAGLMLAGSKFDKDTPLDITGGPALLGGFGFNMEIQPNVLFDISYGRWFSLNSMQHTHLVKIGFGGRVM